MRIWNRPPLGGRFRFRAAWVGALGAALIVAGCSTPRPSSAPMAEAPSDWGDRTVAMTYRTGDPLVAYFAPGQGAGRIYVWDGGETSIAQGQWRLDGRRLCLTLAVFRRDQSPPPPLRGRAPDCIDVDSSVLAGRAYRGDVFSLNGLEAPPYILSQADNERLVTVLHDAERVRS